MNSYKSMWIRVLILILLPTGLVSATSPIVLGFDGSIDENGVPVPWKFNRWSPVLFAGDSVARVQVVEHDGLKALHLTSVDSGFFVGVERTIDVNHLRHARWSWRALALPQGGDFRNADRNDQALQILFGFEGNRVVGYIWDTAGPIGASGSAMAWRSDTRVIVLRDANAPLDTWLDESRNLYADYLALFGTPPPRMQGIVIQSNSQHTESRGEGFVGALYEFNTGTVFSEIALHRNRVST